MEIEGKIIAVLPAKEGVSTRTGNPWMTQDYVLETHDQYPRRCCFNVFGSDKIQLFGIKVGEEMRVSFDIDAHEYQGRWFNSIRAWKVERIDPNAAHDAVVQPTVPTSTRHVPAVEFLLDEVEEIRTNKADGDTAPERTKPSNGDGDRQ